MTKWSRHPLTTFMHSALSISKQQKQSDGWESPLKILKNPSVNLCKLLRFPAQVMFSWQGECHFLQENDATIKGMRQFIDDEQSATIWTSTKATQCAGRRSETIYAKNHRGVKGIPWQKLLHGRIFSDLVQLLGELPWEYESWDTKIPI